MSEKASAGLGRMVAAILVDVDGTLAGPCCNGRRELRASAVRALEMLSRAAPVFLWSIVGRDNGVRLLEEFPQLRPFVSGCYGKADFPLALVERPYAIDDESVDDRVMCCCPYLLDSSYCGGAEGDDLLRITAELLADLRRVLPPTLTDAEVVLLRAADLAALTRLCVACSAFFELVEGQAGSEATAAELLGPLEPQYAAGVRHVFGASVGGELVAVAELLQGHPSARDWYIGLLLVDPRHRRRGLGKRLCRAILDWIARRDGAVVRLVVHQQNGDARQFWDQQGFVVERTLLKRSGRLEGPVSILKYDLLT